MFKTSDSKTSTFKRFQSFKYFSFLKIENICMATDPPRETFKKKYLHKKEAYGQTKLTLFFFFGWGLRGIYDSEIF